MTTDRNCIDLPSKVAATIEKYDMAKKSQRLLVGFSGGADSAALLLCLKELGYSIIACHVNHCLRGDESDRDEKFCLDLCKSYGIDIVVRKIDVSGYCKANSLSTEEGARILRYGEFLKIGADKICTAHNLNDCLETAVFNLARGSGLKGLASIPPVRDNIIRPLIECSRAEAEEYLRSKGQCFVTDSTNLSDDYSRNKIRHNVLPVLEELNPSLMKTYRATAEFLRQDSIYLEEKADGAFLGCSFEDGYLCDKISSFEFPIRRRVLKRILSREGIEASSDKISALEFIVLNSGKINIKNNVFAVSKDGILKFVRISGKISDDIRESADIVLNGCVEWHNRKIFFKIEENICGYENVHKKFAKSCLDYDKIIGKAVIRNRLPGDRIQLVNRSFSSDLRKLMKQAFPAEKRSRAVIIADDRGVVFAEGFGASERVKVDGNTRRILIVCEKGTY